MSLAFIIYTRSIFQEIVSMDTLIVHIMNEAQKLVSADRASLFLVDNRRNELYARWVQHSFAFCSRLTKLSSLCRIFDVSLDPEFNTSSTKEIRFPLNTGIAGHVALTGETLNVADVAHDSRFNVKIDQQTGYITKSILCMPIIIQVIIQID